MWGLEDVRGLVVRPFDDGDSPFVLLSSADDDDIELVAVNPELVHPGYSIEISDDEAAELGATEPADLVVFAVCNLGDSASDPTVNLLAPIVVNCRTLAAAQLVLHGSSYPLRAPLTAAATLG